MENLTLNDYSQALLALGVVAVMFCYFYAIASPRRWSRFLAWLFY